MTLPTVVELKLGEDVESSEVREAITSAGFDVRILRQGHDTIRDVEVLEYSVKGNDSE